MANEPLQCGVAGAGVFGGYHAAKIAGAPGARLARVYDADAARAAARAAEHGARGGSDLAAFLDGLDAVVVATPASAHAEVAGAALAAGCHVLVEKPIALALSDADALIASARARGLVLQVGHQERYVADALGLSDRAGLRAMRARRLTLASDRARDVSVVMDLMIHDLDLLAALTAGAPLSVTACAARGAGGLADHVEVAVTAGPVRAELTASRAARAPARDLSLDTDGGTITLDFLTRGVVNGTDTPLARGLGEGSALSDPLGYGTGLFLRAVRGEGACGVSGEDGRAALAYALEIERAAREAL